MTYEELKNISENTIVKYSVDEGTSAFGYIKDMIFTPFYNSRNNESGSLKPWSVNDYPNYFVSDKGKAMLSILEW